jgi:hypothetical protein
MRKILASLAILSAFVSYSGHAQTTKPAHRPVPPTAQYMERSVPKSERSALPSFGKSMLGNDHPLAVYSHGDPTPEEQYILELINRARANPKAEGDTLSKTTDPDISSAYTYFGTPTRSQVRSDFATYTAQPPLAFNANLITAARKHSKDMLDNNFQSHTGSDGSTFDQRMNTAGYTGWTNGGENIYAYGTSMFDIHASFQIDFGNANLGHRQNIMNFTGGVFREVGIGVLHGGSGLPNVGPIVTTEDFGLRESTFVLGVVYNDKNKNGFYDIGEGLSGVTIRATGGTWSAVTSTSGGYAIPYSTVGTVTVSASGPGLPGTLTKTIAFNGENVKVDFTPTSTGVPGIVTLVVPHLDTTIHTESTKLAWNKISGATNYHVQFGMDTVVAHMVVNDSTMTDSTKTANNLADGTTYYWRVRAKNAKGWGPFTDFASFTVTLAPKKVTLLSPAANSEVDRAFLIWNPSTPNISKYRLELFANGSLVNPIVDDSNIVDTSYTVTQALSANTTYYWRVTAKNELGWGTPSDVRTFKYTGLGVADLGASSFKVSTSQTPNTVVFSTGGERSAPLRLEIFSVTGRRILDRSLTSTEYIWSTSGVAAGVYFYRVSDGSHIETGRISVE